MNYNNFIEKTKDLKQLNDIEKIKIGDNLINILKLKEDKTEKYNPKRYYTTFGNKTALGIYETVKRILENNNIN